jgi:molybdate/tungstate transport system ATP-binding protein
VIEVDALSARVGMFALRDVTFTVPAGAYGVVIGAAGSGKTTLIESIAGIIPATGGRIRLGGVDVTHIPPEARGVGLVYQHAYLFPHLSVDANVAYGASDVDYARDVGRRFGVDALRDRPVDGLSGGERQLVALARAIARQPSVLLLDEPFGALDPRRRMVVRREVRALHRERGLTVLQVTHDFTEAGLLGDVAILLDAGQVLQYGRPDDVFRRPASPYVAEFLGAENVFAGTVALLPDGSVSFRTGGLTLAAIGEAAAGPGHAVIRAEEVVVSTDPVRGAPPTSARNVFAGRVTEVVTTGPLARVEVDVSGTPIVAALTTRSAEELQLYPGRDVVVTFKAMAVHLC